MNDDSLISEWWNEVKDSVAWSGAIVGMPWDDLWEEARNDLRHIWRLARVVEAK